MSLRQWTNTWNRNYYPYGQLKGEIYYKHDIITLERYYYENGQLENEVPYSNGKIHGVEKEWDENGKLLHCTYWWKGQQISKERWKKISRLEKLISGIAEIE